MGFSFDISDLKKFSKNIESASNDFEKFLKDFLLEMANRILSRTRKRTPVRTGDLRKAWQLGDLLKFGNSRFGVEILNGMEYAMEVEYGHRIVRGGMEIGWVDGRFMLVTSINEVQRQIPLRYRNKFSLWLKQKGLI